MQVELATGIVLAIGRIGARDQLDPIGVAAAIAVLQEVRCTRLGFLGSSQTVEVQIGRGVVDLHLEQPIGHCRFGRLGTGHVLCQFQQQSTVRGFEHLPPALLARVDRRQPVAYDLSHAQVTMQKTAIERKDTHPHRRRAVDLGGRLLLVVLQIPAEHRKRQDRLALAVVDQLRHPGQRRRMLAIIATGRGYRRSPRRHLAVLRLLDQPQYVRHPLAVGDAKVLSNQRKQPAVGRERERDHRPLFVWWCRGRAVARLDRHVQRPLGMQVDGGPSVFHRKTTHDFLVRAIAVHCILQLETPIARRGRGQLAARFGPGFRQ
jgi:hypothetical protein